MESRYTRRFNLNQIEFFLTLLLLLTLGLGTLGMVILGGNQYFESGNQMEAHFNLHTSLNYIGMKIRQSDGRNKIYTMTYEDHQVIVITEAIEGALYETWIYQYEDKLYELFTESGNHMDLENGIPLIPIKALKIDNQTNGFLEIQVIDEKGESLSLILYLRGERL